MPENLWLAVDDALPYTGLRGFNVDPLLLHYVPLGEARRLEILPLILIGDRLTIASARPDPDLSDLAAQLPKLRFEIVLAARAELLDALAAAEGCA